MKQRRDASTMDEAAEPTTLQRFGIRVPVAAIASLLLVGIVATIGGLATAESVDAWYPALDKPDWTPPDWLFGPVWTVLYVAMAIAAVRIAQTQPWRKARLPLYLYIVQLVLNLSWSLLFFGMRETGVALFDILILDVIVAWLVVRFWRLDRPAGWLLAPYLAWILFATALNAAIWWMNR